VEGDATIPALFNGLIQLLLEEEREVNDDGAGECIEHFLKGRFLEQMYKMAKANVRKLIYSNSYHH